MVKPLREFMLAAIAEAAKAREQGDYAIGAVIVKNGKIIAKAGNRSKLDEDPTHHAEIVAIRKASKLLGKRHLEGCVLYSTHEPCPMCAAATVFARMEGIVSGARREDMTEFGLKKGSKEWSWRTFSVPTELILENGNPKVPLVKEFMRDECKKLFHA
jgi:tRNA(adenine34) deaminase